MSREPLLTVADVSHSYGKLVAAHHVDLEIPAGHVHCLLGPSGSGKSTLLRLIAGLEKLRSGQIMIAGREVAGPRIDLPPERRAVGFVFQDYALFPHLDVRKNVLFGMPKGARADRRQAAETMLERVGMAAFAKAMPHTLSGGQQQRIALARALVRQPKVMLLDEPFSGLDTRLRRQVREQTLELLRAAGVATLMVTHDPREALLSGDRISVILEGRIAQSAPPAEVYGRSASRRVAEIFGPVNRLQGRVENGQVLTPCGSIPAPGLSDAQEVDISLRPEAVELRALPSSPASPSQELLDPPGKPVHATVIEVRAEGAFSRVRIRLEDGTVIESRDLPRAAWREGQEVCLSFDPDALMFHP